MRAIVKRAYYDRIGLHKVGEVVEVSDIEKMSSLVEPLEVKAEETKATEEVKPKKKTPKKKG